MTDAVKTARQGHRYSYQNMEVLAMESGGFVKVMRVDENQPWPLQEAYFADAAYLTPLPMRYFHGLIP